MVMNKEKLEGIESCIKQIEKAIILAKREGIKSCLKSLGCFAAAALNIGACVLMRSASYKVSSALAVCLCVSTLAAIIRGHENLANWFRNNEKIDILQKSLNICEKEKQKMERLVRFEKADIFEYSQNLLQSDEIENEK